MQSIYQADINFPTNDAQNYAGATKDGSIRLIELPIPSLLRYDEYEVYYKRAFFLTKASENATLEHSKQIDGGLDAQPDCHRRETRHQEIAPLGIVLWFPDLIGDDRGDR